MGRTGSGLEFRVNFGSGRVESLHLWVGLGQVKKFGPTSNSIVWLRLTRGVQKLATIVRNLLSVYTVCVQFTRDLLAIATFLVNCALVLRACKVVRHFAL